VDDGRLRGDGRLGDDFSGGWSDQSDESREDWQSFRDRVDREWRARFPRLAALQDRLEARPTFVKTAPPA